MPPLLSLCIPTCNNENILYENIQSLYQSLGNLSGLVETIIVDNSVSYSNKLTTISGQGLNVSYSHNNQNVGFSRNLFISLSRSLGKYVMILGDDDILPPMLLYDLIEHLQAKLDSGIVFLPLSYLSSANHLSFPLTFMRAGTMSGIVLERSSIDLSQMKLDNTIYPQISLTINAFLAHGGSILLSRSHVELGDPGLSISDRFSDKMNRPMDFGCIERFKILKNTRRTGRINFKDYTSGSILLLEWSAFIAIELFKSKSPYFQKFLLSVFIYHPDKLMLVFTCNVLLVKSFLKKLIGRR